MIATYQIDPVEKAVLGPILFGESIALEMFERITERGFKAEFFTHRSLRAVWKKASQMILDGNFTTEKLISFALNSEDISEDASERSVWIHEVSKSGITVTMQQNALELMERYLKNKTREEISGVKGETSSEILEDLEEKITKLRENNIWNRVDEKQDACELLRKEIDSMQAGTSFLNSSGVQIWDKVFGGLPEAQLIILAGRPGDGKTSLSEQIIDANLRKGTPTLYCQRELSRSRAVGRLAARKADVPWWRFEKRCMKPEEMVRLRMSVNQYEKLPLYLNTAQHCTPQMVAPMIRYNAKHYGVKLVVFDYIQLIDIPKGSERYVAIGELTASMKRAANDTGVTCIGIAQLGRGVEKQKGGKPSLADLRESGNIEQDADIILGLWGGKDRGDDARYSINWSILKNRNGGLGSCEVMFDGPKMEFLGKKEDYKYDAQSEAYKGDYYDSQV